MGTGSRCSHACNTGYAAWLSVEVEGGIEQTDFDALGRSQTKTLDFFYVGYGANFREEGPAEGRNGAQGRNRTTDTRIFSPLLYQLSYLGLEGPGGVAGPEVSRL